MSLERRCCAELSVDPTNIPGVGRVASTFCPLRAPFRPLCFLSLLLTLLVFHLTSSCTTITHRSYAASRSLPSHARYLFRSQPATRSALRSVSPRDAASRFSSSYRSPILNTKQAHQHTRSLLRRATPRHAKLEPPCDPACKSASASNSASAIASVSLAVVLQDLAPCSLLSFNCVSTCPGVVAPIDRSSQTNALPPRTTAITAQTKASHPIVPPLSTSETCAPVQQLVTMARSAQHTARSRCGRPRPSMPAW